MVILIELIIAGLFILTVLALLVSWGILPFGKSKKEEKDAN